MTLVKWIGSLLFLLSSCTASQFDSGTVPSTSTLPENSAIRSSHELIPTFTKLSFEQPLWVSGIPGDTRLLVVEQGGRIFVFDNDESVDKTTPVLDLSNRVLLRGEQGLIGFTLDPAFEENRWVYLHYSVPQPRRSVISKMRWDAKSDQIDTATEQIFLEIEQPYSNHNGGMLSFGPDGYLYIGVGDGGSGGDPQNHGQDLSTLLGTVLRIDVHTQSSTQPYTIPDDNPFLNVANARGEIYAYGLRNPYRFSFDRTEGTLWLGDVGQNKLEEINIINAGGNYGWRVYEASRPFNNENNTLPDSSFELPVFEYDHRQGSSVTGGYVYRGEQHKALTGHYIFGDYGSGRVWALAWDGESAITNTEIGLVPAITSFGETNSGELLVVSRTKGIYRLTAK